MVRSLVLGLFLLVAPLSRGAAQSSADTEGALATVRAFIRANEVSDLDGIVGTFAEGATVFMPVGDAPYRLTGRSQIRQAFADIFKGRTGALTITAPLSFSRRTFVLRREGTQWLIVHHHASNFAWQLVSSPITIVRSP